jgi:hypothetical protein
LLSAARAGESHGSNVSAGDPLANMDPAELEAILADISCPLPDCPYVPPSHLSTQGKVGALETHLRTAHNVVAPDATAPKAPPAEPTRATADPPRKGVRVETKSTAPVASTPKSAVPPSVYGADDEKRARIEARAKEWGKRLHDDVNPLLLHGASVFAGVPESWLRGGPLNGQPLDIPTPDGKVLSFWRPTLEHQLTLSDKDCERLARAGAQFAESNTGRAIVAMLEANSQWLVLGTAIFIAGKYGWNVMKIKNEVAQLKQLMEQQSQMATPQDAENPAA